MFLSPGIICQPNVVTNKNLYQMIQAIGGTSNLRLCLDAGASNSYDGTSQYWYDLSGNNENFILGNNTNVNSYDPTFHGTAGGLSSSEYFSFDGGDRFTSATSSSILNNTLTLNSSFTLCTVMYFSTAGTSSSDFLAHATDSYRQYWYYNAGYGGAAFDGTFTFKDSGDWGKAGLFTYGSWHVLIHRMDLTTAINGSFANGSWKAYVNGVLTEVYPSNLDYYPSGSAGVLNLCTAVPNGTLLAGVALWDRGLSTTEMASLYTQIKTRFTGLP